MYSPEEQRDRMLHQADQARTTRYWQKHSLTTSAVLAASAVASLYVSPMAPLNAAGFILAGVAMYLGALMQQKARPIVATLFMAGGIVAVGYLGAVAELRSSLIWVQGVGITFAAYFAAQGVHQAAQQRTVKPE